MSETQSITMHPTIPSPPAMPKEDTEAIKLNIQFHIDSAHGLPNPSKLARGIVKRRVRVTCEGSRDFERHTDSALEGGSTWHENTRQMGPVLGTDIIQFFIEQHTFFPLKYSTGSIAESKTYTVNSLIALQGKQPEKTSIPIPLASVSYSEEQMADVFLLVRVQEPTTDFVSKRWHKEAQRCAQLTDRHLDMLDPELARPVIISRL